MPTTEFAEATEPTTIEVQPADGDLDPTLIDKFLAAKDRKTALKKMLDEAERSFTKLESEVVLALKKCEDESTVMHGKEIYTDHKWWGRSSVKDDKSDMIAALESDEDTATLVVKDVNHQKLGGWVRKLPADQDGKPVLPDHCADAIELYETTKVGVRKAK